MQQNKTSTRDESARDSGRPAANAPRTVLRPDGPMGYGPHAPAGDRDPESHIFRGED
ncbi:hypothetical protein ABZY93_32050 [Streptomyces smyrnaeus]|uniref:Uncharacterized protein n=1 Tax=Streptomyces smyrnaeus TaxID=1387713 RepID=A0ABS3Y2C2_9ACTN|nr:hypothetical protein [Streptomyces smyrnaeus]MBO8201751.1 hypothetical protein [Streptomyces smyrnaeus]